MEIFIFSALPAAKALLLMIELTSWPQLVYAARPITAFPDIYITWELHRVWELFLQKTASIFMTGFAD